MTGAQALHEAIADLRVMEAQMLSYAANLMADYRKKHGISIDGAWIQFADVTTIGEVVEQCEPVGCRMTIRTEVTR
jgi:hypothetical protein